MFTRLSFLLLLEILVLVLVLGDEAQKHSFISCPFLPCGRPDVSLNCREKELSYVFLAMSFNFHKLMILCGK